MEERFLKTQTVNGQLQPFSLIIRGEAVQQSHEVMNFYHRFQTRSRLSSCTVGTELKGAYSSSCLNDAGVSGVTSRIAQLGGSCTSTRPD